MHFGLNKISICSSSTMAREKLE